MTAFIYVVVVLAVGCDALDLRATMGSQVAAVQEETLQESALAVPMKKAEDQMVIDSNQFQEDPMQNDDYYEIQDEDYYHNKYYSSIFRIGGVAADFSWKDITCVNAFFLPDEAVTIGELKEMTKEGKCGQGEQVANVFGMHNPSHLKSLLEAEVSHGTLALHKMGFAKVSSRETVTLDNIVNHVMNLRAYQCNLAKLKQISFDGDISDVPDVANSEGVGCNGEDKEDKYSVEDFVSSGPVSHGHYEGEQVDVHDFDELNDQGDQDDQDDK